MKYFIYSKSEGHYVGFYGNIHIFSKDKNPTVICNFLSEVGAENYIEVMGAMGPAPHDCVVLPMVDKN